MKTVRLLVLAAALTALVALAPRAEGDGSQEVAYTCRETEADSPVVPDLAAPLTVTASDSIDPTRPLEPVVWTADIDLPSIEPPINIPLHYLRVRIDVPEDVTLLDVELRPPTGEVLRPALAEIALDVTEDSVSLQLPGTPSSSNRIMANNDDPEDPNDPVGLTYPANILGVGLPVVPPIIELTGVATPAAAGSTVAWATPTFETELTYLGGDVDSVSCTPDAVPAPTIVETVVSEEVLTCDGRPVTVWVGLNAPTAGDDVILGTPGPDTVNGLGGNDRFCGLGANDTFNGGAGNDRALGGGGNDTLRGDAGNDRLVGEAGNDVLSGGLGDDTALGGAGADRPSGGAGRDNLQGDAGNDTVNGDGGNDTLGGGAGIDRVNGGPGADRLNGGPQRDTCNGGPQRDTATACEVRISIP